MEPISALRNKVARCFTIAQTIQTIRQFVNQNSHSYSHFQSDSWKRHQFNTVCELINSENIQSNIEGVMKSWCLPYSLKCVRIENGCIEECDFGVKNFMQIREMKEKMCLIPSINSHNTFILYRLDWKKEQYIYFGSNRIINSPCNAIYMYGIDSEGFITHCPYSVDVFKNLIKFKIEKK